MRFGRAASRFRRLLFDHLEHRWMLAADVDSAWQNPFDRFDVNDDCAVTLADRLAVQLLLDAHGTGPIDTPSAAGVDDYFDVNGDGELSHRDMQAVVNRLLNRRGR